MHCSPIAVACSLGIPRHCANGSQGARSATATCRDTSPAFESGGVMKKIIRGVFALAAIAACATASLQGAQAKAAFRIVHAFGGLKNGHIPNGGVIADASGNLYGTSQQGGKCCGTIFCFVLVGLVLVFF